MLAAEGQIPARTGTGESFLHFYPLKCNQVNTEKQYK